jgi:hypothetical protein
MENLWMKMAGETEVLGENLPQRHFVHHKFHLPDLGSNPARRGVKPATNCLSYGSVTILTIIIIAHQAVTYSQYLIYGSTVLLLDLGRFFSFLILDTVGSTPWTGDQLVARPLLAHRTIQTQNKRTQTSMFWVGFEPTIPVFEQAKTVHARSNTEIVGSNPTWSMDVCVHLFCLCCPVCSLATGWSPVQGVLPTAV